MGDIENVWPNNNCDAEKYKFMRLIDVILWYYTQAIRWFQSNFRLLIFKLVLVNGGWGISYANCPQMNTITSYWW